MGKRDEKQRVWEVRRREREVRWQKHVTGWRQSGMSQAEYCRQQGLAPADMSWWKHELARRDNRRSADKRAKSVEIKPSFVPLQITHGPVRSECELTLSNGRCLRIGSGTDLRWVDELVAALEHSAPC